MSLKTNLKEALGVVCESTVLRSYMTRAASRLVNVIYYHSVGFPDPHYQAFYSGCTLSKFRDDLERLSRIYDFVTLDEVVDETSCLIDRKRPALAVTFDDGFDLRKSGVREVLASKRVKATTFVITSCVGNKQLMWRHALSAIQTLVAAERWRAEYGRLVADVGLPPIRGEANLLAASKQWDMRRKDEWTALLWQHCELPPVQEYLREKKPYFDLDGLQEWLAEGHSIGFHTHTHPYCSKLAREDLDAEIIQPASTLGQLLEIRQPLCLSYPFGDRLRPELEQKLFRQGVFKAFFGTRGFKRKGASNETLERVGMEGFCVGWSVFASTFLG